MIATWKESCGNAVADNSDHLLAHTLADEAAIKLRLLRQQPGVADTDRGVAGDRSSGQHILVRLADERPGDAVLMEDAPHHDARLSADRVWIIDPLDGTREFAERDRTDWAVHVALCEGGVITAAAVALPAIETVISTASLPSQPRDEPRDDTRLRIVVSRSRPPAFASALASALDADVVPLGSAGFKTASVIAGDNDMYVHAGGQYEWDTAAPAGVALAVGLHASRIDGSPLRYNQPDPWLPDVLMCRPSLASTVLGMIARLTQAERAV